MRYKNLARAEQNDRELEELVTEYIQEFDPNKKVEENVLPTQDDVPWQKRYSDLRSHTSKLLNEKDRKIADLEKEKEQIQARPDFPKNKEEAKKWLVDYPDLGRVLLTIIEDQTDKVRDDVKGLRDELDLEKAELAKEKAFNQVLKVHRDFAELIDDDEFKAWVVEQPRQRGPVIGQALYDALYNNQTDASAAIEAVNIYKADKKAKDKQKRTPEAALAVNRSSSLSPAPSNGDKNKFLESDIEKLDRWEFDRLESEIELARREGRIVYDISGAAR